MKIFMMDVESIGLHGEAFAVAWLVCDSETGEELDSGRYAINWRQAQGDTQDREWVEQNIRYIVPTHTSAAEMREDFWVVWKRWRQNGAILAADCPWPVESRFLAQCVDYDRATMKWEGPYPLLDVVSVRLGAAESVEQAMEGGERLPDELPLHDPLADCRQSMRVLLAALKR